MSNKSDAKPNCELCGGEGVIGDPLGPDMGQWDIQDCPRCYPEDPDVVLRREGLIPEEGLVELVCIVPDEREKNWWSYYGTVRYPKNSTPWLDRGFLWSGPQPSSWGELCYDVGMCIVGPD